MLTLRNASGETLVHRSVQGAGIDTLLSKEWLLTNERGSYAASTVVGCNTSGYHGLLIGALDPPTRRIMALSSCLDMVTCDGAVFPLATYEFGGKLAPAGYTGLCEFWRDTGVHFAYQLGPVDLQKAVYLVRDSDTVVVEYTFGEVRKPVQFVVRPFVGLRDFHCLQKSHAPLVSAPAGSGFCVRHDVPDSCGLLLACPALRFERDSHWWFNFTYRVNSERGQEATEDLWTPGFFKGRITQPGRIVFWAHLSADGRTTDEGAVDVDAVKQDLARHQDHLLSRAGVSAKTDKVLALAADQFVVKRGDTERRTIVAGFPWFADWGRDAFIALPGLLLATGRHAEAKSVLCTFAGAADEGMIPNRFDDRSDQAHFNSVDASLWFIHAAFQYLDATGDKQTFTQELLPAIRWIIDSYHKGTRFGIRADSDGLITGGDPTTQLTWMDAKYDGITFTPRWGKAVEVNALWHNALCLVSNVLRQVGSADAARYEAMAQTVGQSFSRVFWNDARGYLNDTVMPDGCVDASLRPNQIFAVSLPWGPPLSRDQQRAIVNVVERELLTPYGLRTLNVQCDRYQGRYEGPQRLRDEAYHQGTVWPYLMGPFVEAYLKVHDFSAESRSKVSAMMGPLVRHLSEDGCLGSIAEIFDGDAPQRPRGCLAQAWSVAELIRARRLARDETQ